jgi:hypothetical protein
MKTLEPVQITSAQTHSAQAEYDASWKGRCADRLRHIDPTMFELEAETLAEILWQSPVRRQCPPEDAAAGAFLHP